MRCTNKSRWYLDGHVSPFPHPTGRLDLCSLLIVETRGSGWCDTAGNDWILELVSFNRHPLQSHSVTDERQDIPGF